MCQLRSFALAGMILTAAASRLIPHPPNFTPIAAMALFSGARLADPRQAFLVPLTAMFLSDLAIGILSGDLRVGLHPLLPVIYASFALIVCLGLWLRNRQSVLSIAAATLAGSVLFFVLTNFGVWAFGSGYPKSAAGLVACSVAAIPFFRNALLGDAFYAMALFGGLALAERFVPALGQPRAVPSK